MLRSRLLAQSALLAAIICLLTTFLRLPVPLPQGYVHLGDVAIFAGALLLGRKSAAAAGVGSALADLLSGFVMYAPATFLIKGLMAYFAGLGTMGQPSRLRIALVLGLCGLGMALSYLLFEWPFFGLAAALSALLPNVGQGLISALLALLLLPLLSRIRSLLPKDSL